MIETRRDIPVDKTDIVTRGIFTHLPKAHAPTLEGAVVFASKKMPGKPLAFYLQLPYLLEYFGSSEHCYLRNRNNFQYFVDHVLDIHIFRFGLVSETDAMTQYILGDRPDVFGDHIAAFAQKCIGLGGQGEIDTGPRTSTIGDQRLELRQFVFFGGTCGKNDVQD